MKAQGKGDNNSKSDCELSQVRSSAELCRKFMKIKREKMISDLGGTNSHAKAVKVSNNKQNKPAFMVSPQAQFQLADFATKGQRSIQIQHPKSQPMKRTTNENENSRSSHSSRVNQQSVKRTTIESNGTRAQPPIKSAPNKKNSSSSSENQFPTQVLVAVLDPLKQTQQTKKKAIIEDGNLRVQHQPMKKVETKNDHSKATKQSMKRVGAENENSSAKKK